VCVCVCVCVIFTCINFMYVIVYNYMDVCHI